MERRSRLLTLTLQMAFYFNSFNAYSRGNKGNIEDNYIGCYYNDVNDRSQPQKITLQNNTTLTIEWCIGQCLLRNSTYAGLENSKACLCRNNLGVMLTDVSCNSLCPGNQAEYCGGSNGHRVFYSLYTVCARGYYGYMCDKVCHCRRRAPCDRLTGKCPNECEGKWFGRTCSDIHLSEKYIGCFRDNETRAFSSDPFPNAAMTIEFCTSMCILRNKSIAGLQAGSHCSCGENYAQYGPIGEHICKDPCSGNRSQTCGGPWANSVYSVCPAGYFGPNCHNQCHCYNNSRCVYLTGECNSTCKAGWTGNSCNIRDCTTKDGDCFQNETCTTINLNSETITGCRCSPGYDRKAFWEVCEDIDECVLDLCDALTTDCTNTVGGYNCTCKSGYRQYNETTCYERVKDNYIGCYLDDPKYQHGRQKITLQNNTTLTIELCIGQCLERNSTYAGIENSKECLCRNNIGVMLPDSSCNSPCPGNQMEYCGGSNGEKEYYSLYTVCQIGYYGSMCDQVCHCRRRAPCDRLTGTCPNECDGKWFGGTCSDIHLSEKYIGCFRDNETRAISLSPASDPNMTVEMCLMWCIRRNNSIAGLQAGSHCSCGENYAKYGPLEENNNCMAPCTGNRSHKCGGLWANSVYSEMLRKLRNEDLCQNHGNAFQPKESNWV